MSYAGNSPSIRLLVGCAICLLAAALRGQPAPADPNLADPYMYGPNLIRSLHPVSDAADLLRKSYGMPITYEDPLWEWPGEIRVFSPGVDPAKKGGSTPDWVLLKLPDAASPAQDLPARLAQFLAAYHQQTDGPRFKILTSKLGLHIVPLQVRDRDGRLAPAQNPLDKLVFIPQQERTAHQHLNALQSALVAGNSASNPIPVIRSFSASSEGFEIAIVPRVHDTRGDSFNFMFAPTRAADRPFVWGTAIPNMTARDALIDLLDRSATTFYWDMRCLGTLTVRYNVCNMYIAPLDVTAAWPAGKLAGGKIETLAGARQIRTYDRCGGCEGGRALTHAEQSREKNKK